ncbi:MULTISPECIES: hypothetical protein [Haloferax]|uniref:Uncharacterized protein n=1 Tax=Haloferax marinum TaxID=2666143 RepID=A0A6A8G9Y2_9EURY|nr:MULTISPECIES: hypothetical protein [Haloferax]KAB1198597.1 hypothetical protein Hfx1150_14170 [Haloferax sp. CBA1150]MRW97707.1 hypothetical protein [Haloferax marinum]
MFLLPRIRKILAGSRVEAFTAAALLPSIPAKLLDPLVAVGIDVAGPSAVGFVVYQSLIGNQDLGLALTWGLFGYLVYSHTEMLYPDSVSVSDSRGFRILTAIFAVVFGLGSWGGLIPVAVPGVLQRTANEPTVVILLTLVFLVVGTVVFWYYLMFEYEGDLYDTSKGILNPYGGFFDFAEGNAEEMYNLTDDGLSRYIRGGSVTALSIFPVFVACIVGIVGIALNLFYPLPEVFLFIGLIAQRLDIFTSFRNSRLKAPVFEVDLRLVDSISTAAKSIKGSIVILVSLLGSVLSGQVFLFSAGAMILLLRRATRPVLSGSALDVSSVGLILGLGSILVAICLMGVYSLIYWLRRLERTGAAVEYWEAKWTEGGNQKSQSSVACLDWLLIPAHLPFVAIAVLGRTMGNNVSPVVAALALVGTGVLSMVPMIWGLHRLRQKDRSQREWSIRTDTRDTLLTVLIQFGALVVWLPASTFGFDSFLYLLFFGGVLLTSLYYMPDGSRWASSRDGYWKFAGELPPVVFACAVILITIQMNISPLVAVITGILVLISLLNTAIELRLDSNY